MLLIEQALKRSGVHRSIKYFNSSTRTVVEAAHSLGCCEAQIGKSVVFMGAQSNEVILVVACGTNRILESKIERIVGEEILIAAPVAVKEHTGYAIGGVPPFGHPKMLKTIIDVELLKFETIHVAAGTPRSVISLSPRELCILVPHATSCSVS
jgi:prolyl-tRNA editing enzyme YbaK/EbsC (Cys-tRNA(Pro) deacylase)